MLNIFFHCDKVEYYLQVGIVRKARNITYCIYFKDIASLCRTWSAFTVQLIILITLNIKMK